MALERDVTTYLADGVGMDVKERGDVLQVEVFHNAQNLTCFYDACFPCVRSTGGAGDERHRKSCAIIKIKERADLAWSTLTLYLRMCDLSCWT